MKQFFFLALAAISISVSAQKLQTNEIDEFTGARKLVTELQLIGKSPSTAHACVFNVDGMVGMFIYTMADIGCAGTTDGKITFLFTDNTKFTADVDHGDIDCSETATSIFVLDPSAFAGKTVSKFRMYRSSGFADYTWACPYTMTQLFNAVK
jgi:hypothetical protein